jgi:prepilin-type N-terminal cleavage/methylation domain-containing protein
MKKNYNNKGFTLPELLIALAISSIIMLGIYGAYLMFNNTYYFQRDLTDQSAQTRNIIDIISRDLKMAGYSIMDGNGANSIIAEPIVIQSPTTNGTTSALVPVDCGEGISIEYDIRDIWIGATPSNVRKKITYQAIFFDTYDPPRCRLQRIVDYFAVPFTSSPSANLTFPTSVTETLSDFIWDLSFEIYDSKYNHLAGRRFRNNPNAANTNYVSSTCINNITNNTPCTQTGYNENVSIVDIYLETISPKENPTLQLNADYGRRFLHDVATTVNLRNVGS